MNEVSERVLLKFATLLKNNPNGNVPFLWVQAGGRVASQQSAQPTPPTACEFCGHVQSKTNDGLRNLANTAGN